MEPVLESLAEELAGRALVGKVNVDEQPGLASAARVHAIPTLVLLKNGKVQDVFVGAQAKQKLKTRVEEIATGLTPTNFSTSDTLH
jgi:thioredoxin 1